MRIKRYLDNTKGKVVLGGQVDIQKKYVAPTVVRDVPVNDSLMEEYVGLPACIERRLTPKVQGTLRADPAHRSCGQHR